MAADLEELETLEPGSSPRAPGTPQNDFPSLEQGKTKDAYYTQTLNDGAPRPLGPQLITLSMLPKTQWQNLMHIEAIKV